MLPPAHELDARAAASLKEALRTLQRAFSEGVGNARDFPQTRQVLAELQSTIEKEEAVETAIAIGERLQQPEPPASGTGKHVCCMVDGSMNSFAALRWAIEHLVDPEDDVYLVTVIPFQDFESDAAKILQEAYDFAHNAGVKVARLHPRTLTAANGSRTRGVGESVQRFVEQERVGVLVLGSRGMGSIKRSIMGSLGMGSVSDFCVQHLQCPILMLKEGAEQPAQLQQQ